MSSEESHQVITRETLYTEVWSTPMSQLAPQYELSDQGLAKICRKLNVPRPGRGYWAKKRHEKSVRQTPLPPLKEGEPAEHRISTESQRRLTVQKETDQPYDELQTTAAALELTVPDTLTQPHQFVQKTQEAFRDRDSRQYRGILGTYRDNYLDIQVSESSLDRTLRIMDTLLKAFESLGHTVDMSKTQNSCVIIEGERIGFGIKEKIERVERESYEEDYRWNRYNYVPTGQLKLQITNSGLQGIRKTFGDGKTQVVEELIEEFILTCLLAVAPLKKARKEAEEQAKRWAYRQEKWSAQQRVDSARERHITDVDNQLEEWDYCQKLRKLLMMVETRVAEVSFSQAELAAFHEWKEWLETYIQSKDPLEKTLPFQRSAYQEMVSKQEDYREQYGEEP